MKKIKRIIQEVPTKMAKPKNDWLGDDFIDDESWVKWGLKLISEQRLQDALKCFDHAIELNDDNSDAYYYKGKCLVLLNEGEVGIECIDKAMHLRSMEGMETNINSSILSPDLDNNSKSIGISLRDRLEPISKSKDLPPPNNNYGKYMDELHSDNPMNMRMYKKVIDGDSNPSSIEAFDFSSHRYKMQSSNSELLPTDGVVQTYESEFVKQLLAYQRAEISYVLDYLINRHGGCFFYQVEPQYLFKISTLLLQIVIDEYKMNGVIISMDKPAKNIQKVLRKTCRSPHQPFYIDYDLGGWYSESIDKQLPNEPIYFSKPSIMGNITHLGDNFNFQELKDTIEMNVQSVAEEYEGEHYFIFFDNIAIFQNYTSESEIRKFFIKFAKDLEKLNIFGFFMVPKGMINLSILASLRKLPEFISNKFGLGNK